jgi:CDP-diacylglycerol--glycerol-3-phosphate 3-phosphatidyltransferase
MNLNYKHLPNILTLARIALIPFFVIAFYLPWAYGHLLAAIIFIVAALTDWFDGYLARHFQVTSALGAFLDPVADKLLVSTALVLLAASNLEYLSIPAVIIIGREIAISALREWMTELGKRKSVAVNIVGKIKTIIQMIAIVMLVLIVQDANGLYWLSSLSPWLAFFIEPLIPLVILLAYLLIYLATLLTLWTMVIYGLTAWRAIYPKQS